MKNKLYSWTLAHFAVDMGCFYILYRGITLSFHPNDNTSVGVIAMAVLIYDCIAFGLQMVLGYLADKQPTIEKNIGIIGLALMCVPIGIIWVSQSLTAFWIALILCALLNAAFHVGGGMSVLKESNGKIAPSGIFVSSGALGVIMGTLYGKSGHGALLPLLIVLFCSALYLMTRNGSNNTISKEQKKSFGITRIGMGAATICLFIAVFIRSYAGILWPLGFEKTGFLILIPAVSSFLGKAFGGIIADRIGAMETAVISLTLSLILLMLGNGQWLIIGISIMLFNMAMPITLCGLASAMPNHQGFAFGLSTFALLLGYIAYTLTAFESIVNTHINILIIFLGITAILLIALSLRSKKSKSSC